MYPVILKEAEEYILLDAYYKGRWRLNQETLTRYLGYLALNDSMTTKQLDLNVFNNILSHLSISDKDFMASIKQFEENRMPKNCNFDPLYLMVRLNNFNDGIITPPTSIIEVTPYCNYKCPWCYIPPRSLNKSLFYSIEQLKNNVILPFINERGALEWCLTGGEPTLFPDKTLEVARLISECSMSSLGRKPKRMYMLTTGFDLEHNINLFKDAGINYYQVSLSSPNPDHENKLRRSPKNVDSFEQAIRGIDAIVNNSLNAEINMIIQLNGVNGVDNLYDIPAMIDLAKEHGVRMLRIIPAVPCGQAEKHNNWMKAEEYSEVGRLVREGRKYAGSMIIDCPIDQPIEKDRSVYCRAGTLWLYFDFKGNVYPCNNIQSIEARCWNNTIKTDNADIIWHDSNLLNYMRNYKNETINEVCQECDLRVSCAGECRAMTWARYRQFDLSTKPDVCFKDINSETYKSSFRKTGC